MPGKFITFEGIEGCGKTTQIGLLDEWLRSKNYTTLLTREPGGTPIGEKIRQVLLSSQSEAMRPLTELLLYTASRYQHLEEVILPVLKEGKIVVCDRFADATRAYQGGARKIDPKLLATLHRLIVGKIKPNLTLLLDCPVETGFQRIKTRKLDRLEKETLDFHKRVRAEYIRIAKAEPKRIRIIDALGDVQTVHQKIIEAVMRIL